MTPLEPHWQDCPTLPGSECFTFRETLVTEAGIRAVAHARPGCQIHRQEARRRRTHSARSFAGIEALRSEEGERPAPDASLPREATCSRLQNTP